MLRKSAADAVKRLPLVAKRGAAFAPDSGHLAAFRRAGTGKLSLAASAGDSELPQPSSEEKLSWLMEGESTAQCSPARFSSLLLLPQPPNQYILNLI